MIERLLAAEAALGEDRLDAAERLFEQIATADRRNAIAIVGLARVAHRRGNAVAARELAEQALGIDPEEAAAARLLAQLSTESAAARREPAPVSQPGFTPAAAPVPDAPVGRPSVLARLRGWLRGLLGRRP